MNEELRQVRDTLIEALRHSDTLTLEGRALFQRYAAMSAEVTAAAEAEQAQPQQPAAPPAPAAPARSRRAPADEDEEFGGSFMVRNNPAQPTIPGYRETQGSDQQQPADLPRSLRDRRR